MIDENVDTTIKKDKNFNNLDTIITELTYQDSEGNDIFSIKGESKVKYNRDIFNYLDGFRKRFGDLFGDKIVNYTYQTDFKNDTFNVKFMIEDIPEEEEPEEPTEPTEPVEPPTEENPSEPVE